MMMQETATITRYFRQSLIDSERVCPDDTAVLNALELTPAPSQPKEPKGEMFPISPNCWKKGRLTESETARIFEGLERVHDKPSYNFDEEIVIFPRIDLLNYIGGKRNTFKREVFIPLVVFVSVDRDGKLKQTVKQPWIPRIWLSPNEGQNDPIGDYTVLDAYLTLTPFEAIDSWMLLREYAELMILAVTGTPFHYPLHPEYTNSGQALALLEPPIVGAKEGIIRIYDKIINGDRPSTLYRSFVSIADKPLAPLLDQKKQFACACKHFGQMTGEFPLSPKQRIALHHLIDQKTSGDILAVNGPPGTGKTTLIRSVIANMWVTAAIKGLEPLIITAASNNNQAVTNILESFARINEEGIEPGLAGRWLPEIETYGLFCCAKYKANDSNPYAYHGSGNEGIMAKLQESDYIESAIPYFLHKFSEQYGFQVNDVNKTGDYLLKDLHETVNQIKEGLNSSEHLNELEHQIRKRYGSIQAMLDNCKKLTNRIDELDGEKKSVRAILEQFYAAWAKRPWWSKISLISWLFSKEHALQNARLLNRLEIDLENTGDSAIESYFYRKIKKIKDRQQKIKAELEGIERIKNNLQTYQESIHRWLKALDDPIAPEDIELDHIIDICDRILRFKAFKIATHYWEARWLIETREFVESNDKDSKSPAKIMRKWRRFAKLTPCFVSTFYTLPNFFTTWERRDGTWVDMPLFGQIDLLVVDEAGQALPEVAAAGFSLAKKALVVGDTDQIEPVWSVPACVDRSNLKLFNLLKKDRPEKDYTNFWLDSGLLAGCGNVMRVAQRQCSYHQFEQLQRGLYLTEHRRCYDSIIQYCNDLVYKGVLEPLRGDPNNCYPWPRMGLMPVNGKSIPKGTSRINIEEADAISKWLMENRRTIEEYVLEKDDNLNQLQDNVILQKSVGVVTPFSRQAALIRHQLKHHGLPPLTVGTVHSLQGDERHMVIFSCVYGEGDQNTGKFYDHNHNMLNVAVSRAKDFFLVFGHPEVFGKDGGECPSGKLRKRLLEVK
jgi:Cdc6-like AAA superfamily ATPase